MSKWAQERMKVGLEPWSVKARTMAVGYVLMLVVVLAMTSVMLFGLIELRSLAESLKSVLTQ